ncbi:Red chlorophyll catabolite reductase, chloroplastic [Sesamum angolense]|uniref:Red chlorophyll catabolite reductase, chloroplastic n=1 Tax=Sesamum angolense TaxID=2727404 RepID=A0AAE1WHK4_9LAMI|nr:Red chlorophyll catabolite reductase, chloroplastic [Sesamum angolense]
MAIISGGFSCSAFRLALPSCSAPSSRLSVSRTRSSGLSASMNSGDEQRARLMEFPYVSGPHRDLMVELLSSVETRLGSSLRPCNLPPDVRHFGHPAGTAYASIQLRPGRPSSQIDFILGGWIHCKFPSGGALNITSLSGYLNSSTDAPNFRLELIQSIPTSLVLVLDLTPRKDLILHPDHLKTYYEDTQLDRYRQRLHALPEVSPYISPSLYVRAAVSPTAILVSIDVGAGETTAIEEIIQDHVGPVAKELLQFWMESCACTERCVGKAERAYLAERDRLIKNKTIELDLGSSFPRLFGQDVADRVLTVLTEHYKK